MGQILETNSKNLGLEERRESFYVFDLNRDDPSLGEYPNGEKKKSAHIFAYEDGYIELSKEFIKEMVIFFDDPENRARLDNKFGPYKKD